MIKDVLITVKGLQSFEGEQEETEFVTNGKYEYTAEQSHISYEESEIIGMEGTKTEISVSGGAVEVNRSGSNNHTLVYEKGKKHIGYYSSPYGDFSMAVTASAVKADLHSWGGEICIDFITEFNEMTQCKNSLCIWIKERTS